jgi:hypothetical protein
VAIIVVALLAVTAGAVLLAAAGLVIRYTDGWTEQDHNFFVGALITAGVGLCLIACIAVRNWRASALGVEQCRSGTGSSQRFGTY